MAESLLRRPLTSYTLTIALVTLGLVTFFPALLLFPYHERIGDTEVYSEYPIPDNITEVLRRSDEKLRKSAIFSEDYGRSIFLTKGGWRWHLLTLTSSGSFAITRPLSEAVIVNSADVRQDVVRSGREIGGERSLSGVIAHERTHSLIRSHFGLLADLRYPAELREGYADFIAGEGSLSDEAANALQEQGRKHPALPYYEGRKRVERVLPRLGGSVDRLFNEWPDS